jgi:uncharacterized membrane protein
MKRNGLYLHSVVMTTWQRSHFTCMTARMLLLIILIRMKLLAMVGLIRITETATTRENPGSSNGPFRFLVL